ncbi:MAG: glycosyltransferase [Phycisphaerae bacterium]
MGIKVLFLGTCMPQPKNENMGPWALRQAQAFVRAGIDLRVIRLTPWFPPGIRKLAPVRGVADTPKKHLWGNVELQYFRWPFYTAGALKHQAHRNPWPQLQFACAFARQGLLKIVREFEPDVIYAHHTAVSGYVAYRLHQLTGSPYVVTDHDLDEIADCDNLPARKRLFEAVQQSAAQMCDVSKRMTAVRSRVFPGNKSQAVYNGADPLPASLRQQPRPPEIQGKLVVVCVSAWYDRKGIPKLIEAFDQVANAFPNAVLRLVGDGPDRANVQAAIGAAQRRQQIHCVGMQPHGRAMQEMCWADLYALTGRDEPFATTFSEALMAGLPVIWPSESGHAEILRDGEHGFSVPPWDVQATATAMSRLLADSTLRQTMGQTNRAFAEAELTWDANAAKMFAIFETAHRKRRLRSLGR